MAKKIKLKAALTSQQTRFKSNAKAKAQEALLADNRRNKKHNVSASAGSSIKVMKIGNNIADGTNNTKLQPPNISDKIRGKMRSTIPFQETDKILLVGEGNFSFTRALLVHPSLCHLPPRNVTATAYDSEDECFEKYPESREIVKDLRQRGVEVIFSVDATALGRCKALKGRRWHRVVWNFPHAGKGITDQDRNILTNQLLILGFLRSVSSFLAQGSIPKVHTSRKKKRVNDDLDSDDEPVGTKDVPEEDYESNSESENLSNQMSSTNGSRGTVLITLRNVTPYTEWDISRLAKNPPSLQSSSSKPNPRYIQLRSFAFHRSDWEGYEHRMTKGERHGVYGKGSGTTGQGGEDRTWEFCLKDPE